MAVDIDEVYQQVLALANKEQRGYITPQEFNLYANQAQMDIFNQYFFDLNQFKRSPSINNNYGDPAELIDYKISSFKKGPDTFAVDLGYGISPDNYKVTSVFLPGYGVAQKVKIEDVERIQSGPLTRATMQRPIYYINQNMIHILPAYTWGPEANVMYIRKPDPVNWAYVVVNEKPLYNNTYSSHFELHSSEQKNLIVKILQLAGVGIKDYNIAQAAGQEEIKKIQQEKA